MFAVSRMGVGAAILAVALTGSAKAEPLPEIEVQIAMWRVETLLADLGVDVGGYAQTTAPAVELAPSDHPYLQGNDGGYAAGHVYINDDGIADCRDLTLVHELVHDATVKYRLFSSVPNEYVRDMFEALADAVTAIAAEDPYLPGCLPNRRFRASGADLAALAVLPQTP